jgi:hypothetical protein
MIRWGSLRESTPTENDLEYWEWRFQPEYWAMLCGRASRVVVVDFDSRESAEVLSELGIQAHIITPKGCHVWFNQPTVAQESDIPQAIPTRIRFAKDVDLKAEDSYSICLGKGYQWQRDPADLETAENLQRLFDALSFDPSKAPSSQPTIAIPLANLPPRIPDGERNNTLFAVGIQLRKDGIQPPERLATLLAINEERCEPPLSRNEILRISESLEERETKFYRDRERERQKIAREINWPKAKAIKPIAV